MKRRNSLEPKIICTGEHFTQQISFCIRLLNDKHSSRIVVEVVIVEVVVTVALVVVVVVVTVAVVVVVVVVVEAVVVVVVATTTAVVVVEAVTALV